MENREIEFTITANTKPIENSISNLVEDVGDGTKSLSEFTKKLENMNAMKIDGITKTLVNELKESQVVIKDIQGELAKLNNEKMTWANPPTDLVNTIKETENELAIAQSTANNFSDALDASKISQGMADLDTTFADYIADLNVGIGDMQQFNALVDNATKSEMKDITAQLRTGLENAENELSELQQKLISAIQFDASPKAIETLQKQVKEATSEVNNFKKALDTVGKASANQGGILSKMFGMVKNGLQGIGDLAHQVAQRFKRIVISTAVFSVLGVLKNGLSDACKLSSTATNRFTAMSNVVAGTLIPIVEAFASVVRKALVWIAGLVKYVTGFDMLSKGVEATKKNIQNLGKSAAKSGKQVKDGLLSGLDEINNIKPQESSGGGGSGGGTDLATQTGALGEIESMMAEMNSMDFSWAEPLRIFWQFLTENGEIIAVVLGAIVAGVVAVNVAMWAMSANPVALTIGAIVAAVVALIAIIVLCVKHWDEIKAKVSEVAGAIWEWICNLVNDIGEWFANLWEGIKNVWNEVVDFFVGIFTTAWNGIKAVWNAVVGFFKGIWDGIVNVFNAVIGFYKNIFTTAWNVVKTAWSGVVNFFKGIWDGIKNVFSAVGNWFKNIFSSAYNAVTSVWGKITGFFKGVWDGIVSVFSKIGSAVGSAITDTVKTAVNYVLSGACKIINGFISAINIAIDIINYIPGVEIDHIKKLECPSFDVGTNYVPEDMLAMVHKGERIVPEKYNNDDWVGQDVDMTETNDLLSDLIDIVKSKNLSIDANAIGRASVNYINAETRRRGESVI